MAWRVTDPWGLPGHMGTFRWELDAGPPTREGSR